MESVSRAACPLRMVTCSCCALCRLEGKNADRFRENFAGVDWVKVPTVYWEHSSQEILTLEYVPGGAGAGDRVGVGASRRARRAV